MNKISDLNILFGCFTRNTKEVWEIITKKITSIKTKIALNKTRHQHTYKTMYSYINDSLIKKTNSHETDLWF